jgi:toxin HigB-1
MKIRKVRHKGLRRFMEGDDASALPPACVERIRNIISYLQEIDDPEEVRAIPGWRAHQLTGDRQGCWSLTVNRNWRITYRVDLEEGEIVDLDYEDYH